MTIDDQLEEIGNTRVENVSGPEVKFRQLYEPAVASKNMVEYMLANPFCSREEFRVATNVLELKDKYSEVLYLAGAVLDTRTRVRATYEELSSRVSQNRMKISEILFMAAQGESAKKPSGNLTMGYLDNPLAMVILARGDDFNKLHSPDSGGYYYNSLRLNSGNGQRRVPFIAIRNETPSNNDLALLHEKGHAKNDLVMQSFAGIGRRELWGYGDGITAEGALNIRQGLLKAWNDNSLNPDRKGLIVSNPAWRRIWADCLDYTKDEVIVRLTTGEPMEPVMQHYGSYDLSAKTYNLRDGNGLADYFWEKYTGLLKSEIEVVQKAMSSYRKIGLAERANILPWILMRVPIGSWKMVLNEAGITSEVDLIDAVLKQRPGGWLRKKIDPQSVQELREKQDGLLVPSLIELSAKKK